MKENSRINTMDFVKADISEHRELGGKTLWESNTV